MSSEIDFSWLDSVELKGSAASFAQFCKEELKRRSNADIDFDPDVYAEAVKLVLRKLGGLEMEGMQ